MVFHSGAAKRRPKSRSHNCGVLTPTLRPAFAHHADFAVQSPPSQRWIPDIAAQFQNEGSLTSPCRLRGSAGRARPAARPGSAAKRWPFPSPRRLRGEGGAKRRMRGSAESRKSSPIHRPWPSFRGRKAEPGIQSADYGIVTLPLRSSLPITLISLPILERHNSGFRAPRCGTGMTANGGEWTVDGRWMAAGGL